MMGTTTQFFLARTHVEASLRDGLISPASYDKDIPYSLKKNNIIFKTNLKAFIDVWGVCPQYKKESWNKTDYHIVLSDIW